MKKLTTQEFIEKSNIVHNYKYDYSLVDYKNNRTDVKIICPEHGEFKQKPDKHINEKHGCQICGGTLKLTTKKFIKKSEDIHGNKYDYSLVDYKGSHNEVKIICPIHGKFEQLPYVHLEGCGCQLCGITKNDFIKNSKKIHNYKYDYSLTNYTNSYTKVKIICPIHGEFEQFPQAHLDFGCTLCNKQENFIQKSKIKHNNKYDYSLVDYVSKYNEVKIICPVHGEFEQEPVYHIRGNGCKKCADDKKKSNTEFFIKKAKKLHENKYDYSLVDYIGVFNKVKIICSKHGIFQLTPNDHINCNKRGCPYCKESKGENIIFKYLIKNNIFFRRQEKFEKCINKLKLSFDFYLPTHKICIEYDGIQHYESIDYFGGDKKLKNTKINDNIKTNFCSNNNIKLIRIKYDEDISEKLNNELSDILKFNI